MSGAGMMFRTLRELRCVREKVVYARIVSVKRMIGKESKKFLFHC
jgi:hypothetical protein